MGRFIDLTGQKYNKLTFLRPAEENKNSLWWVRCDCGNEKIVRRSDVISKKIKSCGCLMQDIFNEKRNKILGLKFGRLEVLSLNRVEKKKTYWNCICECGKTTVVNLDHLRSGAIQSCGCLLSETIKERVGEKHPNWKGGIKKTKLGYIMILMKDHPNANKRGYVYQHVLNMSEHLGRPIADDEVIHHINGFRDQNNIGNLQLLSIKEHFAGQRVEDMKKYCIEILSRYKKEYLKEDEIC